MNYRAKNILFAIAFLLLLIVCVKLLMNQFAEKSIELKKMNNQLQTLNSIQKEILIYSRTGEKLNEVLSSMNTRGGYSQENMFDNINNLAIENGLQIIAFHPPYIYSLNEEEELLSYFFTIHGNFKDMIRFIYLAESSYPFWAVRTISFQRKTDYQSKENFVEMILLIQEYRGM